MTKQPPTLNDLPPAPAGRSGWPWTESTPTLPPTLPDGTAWPAISIVTPNYNYAHFLEETIRSVLLQGYPNLQYIIIDDGSQDDSVAVIQRYEPWLHFWISRPNCGQSCSINEGFTHASGYILGWLNSDDVFYPGALAEVGRQLAGRVRTMLVGAATLTDGPHTLTGRDDRRQPAWEEMAYDGRTVPQPSTLWTADLWPPAGPLDTSLRYTMDYDLWLRMVPQAQEVRYSSQLLACERIHENQMSLAAARAGQYEPVNCEKAYAALHAARGRGESPARWLLKSYRRRWRMARHLGKYRILWASGFHRVALRAAFAPNYRLW